MVTTTNPQTRELSSASDETVAGQVPSPLQTNVVEAEDTIALIESARQAALARLPEIFGAQVSKSGKNST